MPSLYVRVACASLAFCSLVSGVSMAQEQITAEEALAGWHSRALLPKEQASFDDGESVQILKWYTVPRIVIRTSDGAPELEADIRTNLRQYVKSVIDATGLGISIFDSEPPQPGDGNVEIFITDGPERFFEVFSQQIVDGYLEGNTDELAQLRSSIGDKNCYFGLGFSTRTGEIEQSIILAPASEDGYATKKCIGNYLLGALGMINGDATQSVRDRTNTSTLPTDLDLVALRIHYSTALSEQVQRDELISLINSL